MQEFKDYFKSLVEKDHYSICVINLQHVKYVDSSGVSAIVSAIKQAQKEQVRLVCCRPSELVFETLRSSRIDKIISICETEQEAIDSADKHLKSNPD